MLFPSKISDNFWQIAAVMTVCVMYNYYLISDSFVLNRIYFYIMTLDINYLLVDNEVTD